MEELFERQKVRRQSSSYFKRRNDTQHETTPSISTEPQNDSWRWMHAACIGFYCYAACCYAESHYPEYHYGKGSGAAFETPIWDLYYTTFHFGNSFSVGNWPLLVIIIAEFNSELQTPTLNIRPWQNCITVRKCYSLWHNRIKYNNNNKFL